MSERRKENGILFFSFWGFICHNIVELIEYCLGLQHYKKLFCFLWNIPLRRHSIFGYATCSVLLRIRNIVSGLVLIAHTYSLQTAHSTNFTEFPHFMAAGFVVHSFYLSFYLLIYYIRLHFNWFFFRHCCSCSFWLSFLLSVLFFNECVCCEIKIFLQSSSLFSFSSAAKLAFITESELCALHVCDVM